MFARFDGNIESINDIASIDVSTVQTLDDDLRQTCDCGNSREWLTRFTARYLLFSAANVSRLMSNVPNVCYQWSEDSIQTDIQSYYDFWWLSDLFKHFIVIVISIAIIVFFYV